MRSGWRALFSTRLPRKTLSPETTCDREGFLHPYRIEGGVAQTTLRILLRDFDTPKLADKAQMLEKIAARAAGRASAGEDRREGHARSIATWPTAWPRSRGPWHLRRRRCAGPGWSRS